MQLRKLGRTELMVSCIGFGGVPLWGLSEEQARRVLNTALDRGVNFIDTARGYRDSEPLIGMSISHRRNAFYIATKTKARKEKHITEEFEASLEYLKTDMIDLYQIHYVNSLAELDDVLSNRGALAVLKKIRESGRIRFIGITGHNTDVLSDAAKTGEFDTVQGAFSYIEKDQRMIDLIHYCSINNIGFIVQKPLAGGAITRASAALKWILQFPVATVIPGMPSVEQVIENTGVGGGEVEFSLSTEELDELDGIVSRLGKNFCRRCYYCQPACPENIRIGVILEFLGKARYPENLVQARRWYRGQKINSSNCTECGLCLVDCPYELPIIEMLKEAHTLLT
jgi:predicted aldo/keto reductase-like oxidoreductase